jgi:undecaprenyl diphosphate synthase
MAIIGKQDRDTSLEETYKKYKLSKDNIPKHIAVIMDGNGRWAKKRHLPRAFGHKEGAESLRRTIKACVEFDIKYLSVYAFSTENWRRPEEEVSFLMRFFQELIAKEIKELKKQGVRVRFCGDRAALGKELQVKMNAAEELTNNETTLQLNLLVNYGARDEIVNAAKGLVKAVLGNELAVDEINEDIFNSYIYTADSPDPDILIRTGGDNIRLSNYMLWQVAYSEMFFIDALWPEFNKDELIKILTKFQKRERRFGGVGAE